MKQFLVETVELVKKQYLVKAEDQTDANDQVAMNEVPFYDKCKLSETIVSSRPIDDYSIPFVDPIKDAKIAVAAGNLDLSQLD